MTWLPAWLPGPILTATINNSAGGDIVLVPALAGHTVTLVELVLVIGGTTNLTFKDGQTSLSGPMPFTANMSIVLDLGPWYSTTAGNALNLNSSSAAQISGTVFYVVGK